MFLLSTSRGRNQAQHQNPPNEPPADSSYPTHQHERHEHRRRGQAQRRRRGEDAVRLPQVHPWPPRRRQAQLRRGLQRYRSFSRSLARVSTQCAQTLARAGRSENIVVPFQTMENIVLLGALQVGAS